MLKIGVLGVTGILMAMFVKETKPQFAVLISMTTCLLIFFYVVSKLSTVIDTIQTLQNYISVNETYLMILLKIVGITYIAEFSANLCKDAGYGAVAGQIEFFGKISIMAISAPVITALFDTINEFLG